MGKNKNANFSKSARCPVFKFFVVIREVILQKMAPILAPVNFFFGFDPYRQLCFFSFAGLFLGFWAFSAFFDHFLATALLCLVKHPSYKQYQDDKVDYPTFMLIVSCSMFKPAKIPLKTIKPLNHD